MKTPQIIKLVGLTIIGLSFPVWVVADRQSWLFVLAGLFMIAYGSIYAAESRSGGDSQ